MLCGEQSRGGGSDWKPGDPRGGFCGCRGKCTRALVAGQRWRWRGVGWACDCLVESAAALVNPSKAAETWPCSPPVPSTYRRRSINTCGLRSHVGCRPVLQAKAVSHVEPRAEGPELSCRWRAQSSHSSRVCCPVCWVRAPGLSLCSCLRVLVHRPSSGPRVGNGGSARRGGPEGQVCASAPTPLQLFCPGWC